METNVLEKEEVKVIHHVDRTNLYDFGYEKSGSTKGDPDVYATYLNRIINGDLVEKDYSGLSEEDRRKRKRQIKELEEKLEETEIANARVNDEIKAKEKEIEKHRKELLQIHDKRAKDTELAKKESFSVLKFSLNLFILSMLSVYLFFFYVSATFKALYVDFEGIAESIANGEGTGSIMPGAYELAEALQYNYLLFVVPFVFYAFGWAFHILLDVKGKQKYVYLSLLIGVTFAVDFLLAMIINNNIENAKALMGLPALSWSESPSFYIILFLGFLVYIIWSILLDSLLREWSKKEITDNLKKIIKHLQGDIKILQKKLGDVESIKARIADFRDDIAVVMYGNLKRYIDQFTSGWISYLSPTNLKDTKEKCLQLKKEFEEKNNIRSGTVKVMGKRIVSFL
ncbi:MAG: hypothetical protein ACOYW3_13455 [Bacteroidota bacterium]